MTAFVLWGKPRWLPCSIKISGGTVKECRRERLSRQREGHWRGLRLRSEGYDDHRLFTRLDDSDGRFLRMCKAVGAKVRHKPVGHVLGWTVYVLDGKAYLFRSGRTDCRVADWFEFCHACRSFGVTHYWKGT